ncbi:MAG: hypothetical protein ACD_20C00228G0003 [uncultured bacterium]|nr:MAG: hypothetical protein ACD_20C00228G0003 [uncultured bacterium]
MIKIIVDSDSLEVVENYINLCNLLNQNNYECTIYGLTKTDSERCKSSHISMFSPQKNDTIILDNISVKSVNDVYNLARILNPPVYSLKKNKLKYKIKRWIKIQKEKLKIVFELPKPKNFDLITNLSAPIVDIYGQNLEKTAKIAGVLTVIKPDGQIEVSIKKAIDDGMEKVLLFGRIGDPVYYHDKISPILKTYHGKVQYCGYPDCREKIYSQISHVYDFSKNRNLPYLEMEFTNNNVALCSNHLLTYVKKTEDEIIETLSKKFNLNKHKRSNITVVLNGFRRGKNLEKQINALKNQTIKPDEIMLWYNDPGKGYNINRKMAAQAKSAISNENWGVWARFYYAMNAKTKYICVFDDDTIPGSKWLENCLETIKEHRGLLGTIGLIYNDKDNYYNHTRYGWANPNKETTKVDIVGHSWFFEKEFLTAFCREWPLLDVKICGEDIHFSYTLQKYLGLNTYVPPHPENDQTMWGSLKGWELGVDNHAISHQHIVNSNNSFLFGVNDYFKECQKNGWKLIKFEEVNK